MPNTLFDLGFKSGKFSDIAVTALGETYNLHRIILLQNDFFSSLLDSVWAEKESTHLHLKFDDENITQQAIQAVFGYIYGFNDVQFSTNNVYSIIATASFFGEKGLLEEAMSFVSGDIRKENLKIYTEYCENANYGVYTDKIEDRIHVLLSANIIEEDFSVGLNMKWIKNLFISHDLFMHSEFERYTLLKRLVAGACEPGHELLSSQINYTFMNKEQINMVKADGIVSRAVIEDAHFRQMEFQNIIERCPPQQIDLNLETFGVGEENTGDCSFDDSSSNDTLMLDLVPSEDTTKITDHHRSPRPEVIQFESKYPPFRFGHTFTDLDTLINLGNRVYSLMQFYGGSFWVVYFQSFVVGNTKKLGVYL